MRNTLKTVVHCAAIAAAFSLPACDGGGGGGGRTDMPAVTPPQNMAEVRNFNTAELDTLRALKARNRVTRDEYWDDRGGVLGNEWFDVWYPPGKLTVSHGMYVLDTAMKCRREVEEWFGRVPEDKATLICTQTMDAYTDYTGRFWWHYASIEKLRIIYQPVPILAARGLLDVALPREAYEWCMRRLAGNKAPSWLIEGLASHFVDEETILEDNLGEFPNVPVKMSIIDIEAALAADNDKQSARIAYYNAYMMVKRLDHERGRDQLIAMVNALGDGSGIDDAARAAFGMSYDELVTFASEWSPPAEMEASE